MASRWMAPKLAKMARERKANAPIIRAQKHNNVERLNAERAQLAALVTLASSSDAKVTRVKPGSVMDSRDVGREGKRRRSFDKRTYGNYERRDIGSVGRDAQTYNYELLVRD